jgi:hypothetical protein
MAGPQFPRPVEDLANIEFRADVRLFSVMAALNAAGFDYEDADQELSDVRLRLRKELQSLDPGLVDRLRAFYRSHRGTLDEVDTQVAYVSLALLMSNPPDFKLSALERDVPADVRQVSGFELLVEDFYHQADIGSLWQRYRIDYEQELQRYRPVVRKVIEEGLRYFRVPLRVVLDRKIVLMPDLLNAKNIVNARNMENFYYIAVGPTEKVTDNYPQLQHEYLHFLVDPLVQKYGAIILKYRDLLELAQKQPRLKPEYTESFLLMVTESIIESISLRLRKPESPEREIADFFHQGLILVPYFHRRLQRYEESRLVSFPAYLEISFQDLKVSEVKDDVKSFAAADQQATIAQAKKSAAQQEAARAADRRFRVNSLLREASHLLSEKQYALARQRLEELLKEDPNHGSAYFYLAQIASQTQQYDQALAHYTRASQAQEIPDWVRAWSLLRIGRLLTVKGDLQQAAVRFREVLEMEGELSGAREQAQESLALLLGENVP